MCGGFLGGGRQQIFPLCILFLSLLVPVCGLCSIDLDHRCQSRSNSSNVSIAVIKFPLQTLSYNLTMTTKPVLGCTRGTAALNPETGVRMQAHSVGLL